MGHIATPLAPEAARHAFDLARAQNVATPPRLHIYEVDLPSLVTPVAGTVPEATQSGSAMDEAPLAAADKAAAEQPVSLAGVAKTRGATVC